VTAPLPDELTGFLDRTELRYATDWRYRLRLLAEGQHTIAETLQKVRAA
jgi:hypothetical protein